MSEYKISNEILEKMKNGKFYKKDMRFIIKEISKFFGLKRLRGLKEIELIGKIIDGGILIYEIIRSAHSMPGVIKDYGYDIYLFNTNGVLVYDESDGEITKVGKIKTYVNYFDKVINYNNKNNDLEKIKKKLFYPYMI